MFDSGFNFKFLIKLSIVFTLSSIFSPLSIIVTLTPFLQREYAQKSPLGPDPTITAEFILFLFSKCKSSSTNSPISFFKFFLVFLLISQSTKT